LNKNELIEAMAEDLETKQQAAAALQSMLQAIETTLKTGDSVSLTGFGTFKVQQRKERNGVNPKTGEKITIAASRIPKFVASKKLKDVL